jgi:uncharacterized protein YbgA (DUF1722 family)/uncharacterized protein YbbK (DUF523 family)
LEPSRLGTTGKTPRVGISTCLLGEPTRYDGGLKLDGIIKETLGRHLELVPVCPEVESGLSVPREAMQLEGDPENPRLFTRDSRIEYTERLLTWSRQRVEELENEDLCGFIFKSRSPSCGTARVKVHSAGGVVKRGQGLFAREFMRRFPLLPVEEEDRLVDRELRENFIERLFACQRWQELLAQGPTRGGLVDFHADHKLLLMAHSPQYYREMGRLVARAEDYEAPALFARYGRLFMAALRLRVTPGKNANVLQHVMGYFKRQLTADEKQELQEMIEQCRRGLLPLLVPITLFNHHVRKHGVSYLARQWYLRPHPLELKLRNHA